jgi:putative transposase
LPLFNKHNDTMRFDYWQTFYENSFYHIYNRAIGTDKLFVNEGNYQYFLGKWKLYIHPYVDTYAYCLMSNHYHFLARIKTFDESLMQIVQSEGTKASKNFCAGKTALDTFMLDQFKRFFSAYALAFNKQRERHGSLFQESFKRIEINNEVKLLNTLCYIHHNPIHHELSTVYNTWKYSSYNAYLSDEPTLIARREGLALFDGLGSDTKAYNNYHGAYQIAKMSWKRAIDWDDELLMDEE